jgi:hypothetical protein
LCSTRFGDFALKKDWIFATASGSMIVSGARIDGANYYEAVTGVPFLE